MLRPPETFLTDRLSGRPPTPGDAPAAFEAYASDPEVTRYLSWRTHERVETLEAYLAAQSAVWEKGEGQFSWMLALRDTGRIVGSIGIAIGDGKALFGYVLGRAHWGRGLTPEALGPLVDWALARRDIHRAHAFCDVDNPNSARVMEKAGMVREGILRRWHVCPNIGPEPRDCIVCAKTR
jgi:RimJ/RimL family protein N-acetyltransferase